MTKRIRSAAALFFMAAVFFLAIALDGQCAIVSTGHQKYKYSEMKNDLEKLENRYGDHCKVIVIGTTADKRKLYEVIIGNQEAKKHLYVISNLHAREYMTITLAMKQIEQYLSHYNSKVNGTRISKTLNKVAIHFIPSANPDGTAISQYGFGAIRNKTLRNKLRRMGGSSRRWKANARGVDLNRNWNVMFRRNGSPGSSGYRGPRAESEKEVKAIVKRINKVKKTGKIVGIVSYHSTGSVIYGRCAGQAKKKTRNATTRMYKVARSLTGYSLMPTQSISSGRGCSREYYLYRRQIPFITIEVGRGACPLGAGEFPSIWRKNRNLVIREAMLFD